MLSADPLAKLPIRAVLQSYALQKKWWWAAISGMIITVK